MRLPHDNVRSNLNQFYFTDYKYCLKTSSLRCFCKERRLLPVLLSLYSVFPLPAAPHTAWGPSQSFMKVVGLQRRETRSAAGWVSGAQPALKSSEFVGSEPLRMRPWRLVSHSSNRDRSPALGQWGRGSFLHLWPSCASMGFSLRLPLFRVGNWERHSSGFQRRRANLTSTGSICRASAFVGERDHRALLPCAGLRLAPDQQPGCWLTRSPA